MAERQFHGSSSSSLWTGCSAMRARTSASQACGSTSFILAVTIRLYITAARSPPHDRIRRTARIFFPERPREHQLLALSLATRVLGQISHHEERPPGMDPARGLQDRTCVAARFVKPAIAAVGVSLEDSAVIG